MKTILSLLLLLPFFAPCQVTTYYSADASANFGRHIEFTGYSVNLSGNIQLMNNLYLGLATGALQVKPFISHLSFPLTGRVTFFTTQDEEGIAPFGLFEVGKLFYSEDIPGTSGSSAFKGKLAFFTGVGLRFPSQKHTRLFVALGYTGFNYIREQYSPSGALVKSEPDNFRRIAIKVGVMLPK